ncbi:kinase-like domain-containing protein, partial [Glomus cerebriforme]
WRFEKCDTNRPKILLDNGTSIDYHIPQDFENLLPVIGTGGFSSVYAANWKITQSKFAIKKFATGLVGEKEIENEIRLMEMVKFHPNIIKFLGVTKFTDEINYSLVLEYADGGTLGSYLKDNARTFKWENQLKFAKEIASAVLCLHENEIIHGDLHSDNVLIHQHTIKLADFGCAHLQGSDSCTKARGVIPYMDPKIFNTQETELVNHPSILK